jgi:ribosomal protein RSM22 (predicted rRNA methylase)
MISPSLPAALKAALDAKLDGVSRNEIAPRAASMSRVYREGSGSTVIRNDADALAYALVRMPATYASLAAALDALIEIRPDLAPQSLLDVGAGPGTATWAASQAFASLADFALIDANAALRALALELAQETDRLRGMTYDKGEALALLAKAQGADLVIASYMIGELDEDARDDLAGLLWAKTRDTLVVIEPGTPAGYARIMDLRTRLIASGAHVAAPCPHEHRCPLRPPDWCHFSQRLPRSQAHRQIKGAELPFEDEKFAYVALSRTAPERRLARVLAPPVITKIAVTTKACTADGLAHLSAPRRDKPAYAVARKRRWGDLID